MTKVKRKPGKHALYCKDPHLTKQDHGGMANINEIGQMYSQGRLPYPENPPAVYGDISALDVQKSRDILASVDSAFAELPSEVRDNFQTSEKYIEWLDQNAENVADIGLQDALWEHIHPEPAVAGSENLEESSDPGTNIGANAPENGAAGDDPPAT